jgi:hypothetical protein
MAGIAVGAALAIGVPLLGSQFFALSVPARADSIAASRVLPAQTVNRAAKSDRLGLVPKAIGTSGPVRIPEGCDPAFSPLSKAKGSNFSGRCLA